MLGKTSIYPERELFEPRTGMPQKRGAAAALVSAALRPLAAMPVAVLAREAVVSPLFTGHSSVVFASFQSPPQGCLLLRP